MKQTISALIARGLDSEKAKELAVSGFTLNSLKMKTKDELVELGLSNIFINNILKEERPPIPVATVNELLYESRYRCCICRDTNKSVIIHHIVPWEESHSHEKNNLVVLCLQHHDEAHTKKAFSLNLTPERIKDAKQRWIEQAKQLDYEVINDLIESTVCWDFFNINRIFEQADQLQINYLALKSIAPLISNAFVDNAGRLLPINKWSNDTTHESHWLSFFNGHLISSYMADILLEILKKYPPKILNKLWGKKDINKFVNIGDLVFLQGAFRFKRLSKNSHSIGQMRKAYRTKQNIRFEFDFDAYYSTTMTSKCCHLSGNHVESVFAIIREINNSKKETTIKATCLAMGSWFKTLPFGRSLNFYSAEFIDEDEEYFEDE